MLERRFAPGELVDALRARGSAYGPDVNASTSVFETVFRLSVELTEESSLRSALEIMREWRCVL